MPPLAAALATIGSAIASGAAAFSAWAAAHAIIANILISTALSFVANKLQSSKKPNVSVQERQASVLQLSLGEAPRSCILGTACVGGSLMDAFNAGATNEWEYRIIAIADHRCHDLLGFYVNDKFYDFVPGIQAHADFQDNGASCLDVRWIDGSEARSLEQIAQTAGTWAPEDTASGMARVEVGYRTSDTVWPSGRPDFRWVVKGYRCYDPRKDSTVPGGSGAHRWGVPSTYEYTENAIVCYYNWKRGIYSNGQLMVGPGKSAAESPPEDIISDANVCDELVQYMAGGGMGLRYFVGTEIRADEEWITVEENFAASVGGDLVERNGGISIAIGIAQTPVTGGTPIVDADFTVGKEVTYSAKITRDQLVNTIIPSCVDSAQLWEAATGPMRRSIDDITSDGQSLEQSLSLPYVNSMPVTQRVAEIARRKARLQERATLPLGPKYMTLEPGDWVEWTSARYFGGQTRTFSVEAARHGDDGNSEIELRRISASVYSWDAPNDELNPNSPPYLPAGAPAAAFIDNFAAVPFEIDTGNGTVTGIKATWTPPNDPTIRTITLEYRPQGSSTSLKETVPASLGEKLIAPQLVAVDTAYEIRETPVPEPRRDALTSAWRPVMVEAPVTVPVFVANFAGYQAGDQIRFNWSASPDPAMRFEIRNGESWELGRLVFRGTGTTTSVSWPIRDVDGSFFYIKQLNTIGAYSTDAQIWIARVIVQPSRNQIVTVDFIADEWPGVAHDMHIDGDYLALDESGGFSVLRGDYYQEHSLIHETTAQTWINQRINIFLEDTPTWDESETAWEDLGDVTWAPVLGDAAASLSSFISLNEDFADGFLEGFRFNDTLVGAVDATMPAVSTGTTYGPARVADGVAVFPSGALIYDLEVGVEFSEMKDFRIDSVPVVDSAILTFSNSDGDNLAVFFRASDGAIVLRGSDAAADIALPADIEEGDTVSVSVWQTETARGIVLASRRHEAALSGEVVSTLAAVFTKISVGGPTGHGRTLADLAGTTLGSHAGATLGNITSINWRPSFPAFYGDLAFYESAVLGQTFAATWATRGPVGYSAFEPFDAGDRKLTSAVIWLLVRAPAPTPQTAEITQAEVIFDVPDLVDGDQNVTVGIGGIDVVFDKPFFTTPAIVAQQTGGAFPADAIITDKSETGFHLELIERADGLTSVVGAADWIAKGW